MADTHQSDPIPCPVCNSPLSGHTGRDSQPPSPGDPTVCVYCRRILVFTDDLGLRLASTQDEASWDDETRRAVLCILGTLRRLPHYRRPVEEVH